MAEQSSLWDFLDEEEFPEIKEEPKKEEKNETKSAVKASSSKSSKSKGGKPASSCEVTYPLTFKAENYSIELDDYNGFPTSTLEEALDKLISEHDVYQAKAEGVKFGYKDNVIFMTMPSKTSIKAAVTDFPVMVAYGRESKEYTEDDGLLSLYDIVFDFSKDRGYTNLDAYYDPKAKVICLYHGTTTSTPKEEFEVECNGETFTYKGDNAELAKKVGYPCTISLAKERDDKILIPVPTITNDFYTKDVSKYVLNNDAAISEDTIYKIPLTVIEPLWKERFEITEEMVGSNKAKKSDIVEIIHGRFSEHSISDLKNADFITNPRDKSITWTSKGSKLG